MNKIIAVLLMILILPIANAQQTTTDDDPGITPDSFLWGLDKALDQLTLLLTFDKGEKARKGLEIARERLLEVKEMVEENKLDAAEKAQEEHGKTLVKVKQSIKEIEEDDSIEEIKEVIEVEKELEEHKSEIETIKGELKVKIEVKGEITPEQQTLIDSVLSNLENKTGEVEIEIENKKGETKIKIKQETRKSDKEVDKNIKEIEKKKGLAERREKKIEDMRNKAKEHISALEKNVNCVLLPSLIDIPVDVSEYTNKTTLTPNEILKLAKEILADSEAKEDWEEAKNTAELAKDLADKVNQISGRGIGYWRSYEECPKLEEVTPEVTEEPRLKIKAEIKANQAEVEIEIDDAEWEFVLYTTNRDEIIAEIASRTGLSISEIENIMKLELEEEIEIEVEEEIEKEEEEEEKESKEKEETKEEEE